MTAVENYKYLKIHIGENRKKHTQKTGQMETPLTEEVGFLQ